MIGPTLGKIATYAFLAISMHGAISCKVSGQDAEPMMAKYQPRVDDSIERGLAYLAKQQLDAGEAQAMNRPELVGSFVEPAIPGDTGITSLAVMAFLAKGHLPGHGPYGELINSGIDYVLTQQLDNGLLISKDPAGRSQGLMYSHSIATLLLCEVSGMVDLKRQKRIDEVLPKALLLLLQAQKVSKSPLNTGGWRYGPGSFDSDLSLTGWSIMALRAAKLNGAAIPDEHIAMAVSYVLNCREPNTGAFTYIAGDRKPSTSMTGIAVLCLELCGEHGNEDLIAAGNYILANPPQILYDNGTPAHYSYYSFYYCGQAMFQLGGRYWNEFAPYMFDSLLDDQRPNGSWTYPENSFQFNTTFPTAMAVLTLTVPARQLPIYQRGE